MDPLTMSLIAAGGSAIGALPDIIPSKYERDQKKRLQEMQRKQEMGALGLTKAERDAIEGQMRGARRQAQQYADAERARLTQPTAQPQMALLGQQMADEGRQRLEADLASQILGMDLSRQAQQEQEIKDLEAAQAQYRRARAEGLTAPFQVGAETAVGQMGMDRLLKGMGQNQIQNASAIAAAEEVGRNAAQQAISNQPPMGGVDGLFPNNPMMTMQQIKNLGLNDNEMAMLGISPSSPQLSQDALFLLQQIEQGQKQVQQYLGGQ